MISIAPAYVMANIIFIWLDLFDVEGNIGKYKETIKL